jgi:glycosidase
MPALAQRCLVVAALAAAACGSGTTDAIPLPPNHPFDPGVPPSGSYGSGSGSGAGPIAGPPMCDLSLRRCAHEFHFGPQTLTGNEKSVSLMGDYRADSWVNGDALTFDGSRWTASVAIPWSTQVIYKFHVFYRDGSDKWLPDPSNPKTVADGFGGLNSVLAPSTCDPWTCASAQIACPQAPLAANSFDWRDSVIYWAFVDRFLDGNPGNDMPISVQGLAAAANWQGGDWAGIIQKMNEGYFKSLGINTLWITMPTDSSESAGLGTDNMLYSGYHGYWPRDLSKTEARFGSDADLRALVSTAHAGGIKVIVDYAMHHVHTDSPTWLAHMSDGWFTPLVQNGQACVCGTTAQCSFDGATATTCWFASYLPTFDFSNTAARQYSINNALSWIENFGFDGFRLDAIKQIQPVWLSDFRAALLAQVEAKSQQHVYLVGETFSGDRALIKNYISPCGMLDGQFDFPLRAALNQAVLMRAGKMSDLITFMDSNTGFYGNAVMSTFVGNHDLPRAIHFAEDAPLWSDVWANGKDRNWSNQPAQPASANPYERLAVAFAILFTNRGAPLVYYGDEIGLAGAGDPDNRRMMPWMSYSPAQQQLFAKLQKLGAVRAAHSALRRGDRTTLSYDDESWLYQMTDGGDRVWVAINRSDSAKSIAGLPAQPLTDQLTGEQVSGPSLAMPPRSARVLTP